MAEVPSRRSTFVMQFHVSPTLRCSASASSGGQKSERPQARHERNAEAARRREMEVQMIGKAMPGGVQEGRFTSAGVALQGASKRGGLEGVGRGDERWGNKRRSKGGHSRGGGQRSWEQGRASGAGPCEKKVLDRNANMGTDNKIFFCTLPSCAERFGREAESGEKTRDLSERKAKSGGTQKPGREPSASIPRKALARRANSKAVAALYLASCGPGMAE
jgi:hypothetical protein